ncbi:MAG: hypothetical protein EBQ92_00835, partial [Proteobacteria bacterium]|nr:hypothetical protein [Pseudomonadota bacterium]
YNRKKIEYAFSNDLTHILLCEIFGCKTQENISVVFNLFVLDNNVYRVVTPQLTLKDQSTFIEGHHIDFSKFGYKYENMLHKFIAYTKENGYISIDMGEKSVLMYAFIICLKKKKFFLPEILLVLIFNFLKLMIPDEYIFRSANYFPQITEI